jgi:HEPN domain-containing protein
MPGPPDSDLVVRRWIAKAENDLRAAKHILTITDECPFDTACFHAQQCVERYFKAVLVRHAIDFPRSHDLDMLLSLLPASVSAGIDLPRVLGLNRYSVEARYPGDWDEFDRPEAEEAVAIAREVATNLRGCLRDA